MKVINSLIAVEVPRGVKNIFVDQMPFEDSLGLWYHSFTYHQVQLPFPAEIIGLASEIDEIGMYNVLQCAKWSHSGTWYEAINELLDSYGFTTTPTTDIIFLRKK